MLLKIDFNQDNVVYQGKGRVIIKCKYYAQFSTAAHLVTTRGNKEEDFDNAPKGLSNKSLFVGLKGGISLS